MIAPAPVLSVGTDAGLRIRSVAYATLLMSFGGWMPAGSGQT
jgi:hypothetical protein